MEWKGLHRRRRIDPRQRHREENFFRRRASRSSHRQFRGSISVEVPEAFVALIYEDDDVASKLCRVSRNKHRTIHVHQFYPGVCDFMIKWPKIDQNSRDLTNKLDIFPETIQNGSKRVLKSKLDLKVVPLIFY